MARRRSEHLFRRPNRDGGIWYAWINERQIKDGVERFRQIKRSTGTASIELARVRLANWERDAADPSAAARREAKLSDPWGLFYADRKRLIAKGKRSKDSIHFYENQWKAWALYAGRVLAKVSEETDDDELSKDRKKELRDLGATMALQDFDRAFRDGFVEYRSDQGCDDETIGKNLSTMASALRLAKENGKWQGDLETVFPRFDRGGEIEDVHWTHEDAAKVLTLFDRSPHRKAQIAFSLATGAEKRAIRNALRSELDRVPIPLHGTKTSRRDRVCFVVFEWQRELLELARAGVDGENGKAFTNWANSTRDLADACTRAKVQVLSMHDLRHVFSGWALDDGISMLEVAKALGHRNTRQLEERYDNRDPGVLQRRAEEQAAQRRQSRQLVAIEGGLSAQAKATA